MAEITAALVKELREKTGAGMMDCKKALNEVAGDLEKAVDWLRTKGLSAASKKAGRVAAEGLVGVMASGTKGAVIEVNAETDFVGRNEQFQKLVKEIGMQIAGLNPLYVSRDHIPADVLAAKRAALEADESLSKKPESVRAQIVDGQMRKWFEEVCLLDQPFRDGEETVAQLITSAIATIGENIRVRRFVRYALGEEI